MTDPANTPRKPNLQIPPKDTYILIGVGRLWIPDFSRHGAGDVRDLILQEITNHDGDLFIVDDVFSEWIDENFDNALVSALNRLYDRGSGVGRYWGCESETCPDRYWEGFGEEYEQIIYPNVEEAAQKLGRMVLPGRIRIAGAWLGASRETGQVNEVLETLRDDFGHTSFEIDYRAFADPLRP